MAPCVEERFGTALPCLEGAGESEEYAAYLAIIPGDMLNDIYGEYGPRLLELNVRTFLQAKGKIKDLETLKATVPGIGKECGGCHETYRLKTS